MNNIAMMNRLFRLALPTCLMAACCCAAARAQAPPVAAQAATNTGSAAEPAAAPKTVTPPSTAGPLAANATLPEAQWESQVITGQRKEYVTQVETMQQQMIQPVVKYHLEYPFFGGQPQWVARTYYEPRTVTVAIPRTYQTMVPQTQVVRRPVSAAPTTQLAARPTAPSVFQPQPNSQPVFVPPSTITQAPNLGPDYSHQPMIANQPVYIQPQATVAASPLLWSAPAHTSGAPAYRSAGVLPVPNAAPYGRADLSGYGSVSSMDGDPPRYGVRAPQYGNQLR